MRRVIIFSISLILIEQILPCKRGVENYYVEFDQLPDGMVIFQAVTVEPVFKPVCQEFGRIGHPGLFLLF
jgi:hypothetical protein